MTSNFKLQISNSQQGFTLIEVLIALALGTIILGLGLFVSFDFYKSYSARSEQDVIISTLQKARGQAMNNINQKPHGVHFSGNPLTYTLFEGPDYATSTNSFAIPSSYGISITSPSIPFDIVFEQLSGKSSNQNITLNNNDVITINSEGQISW